MVDARARAGWETRPSVKETKPSAGNISILRANMIFILANGGTKVLEPVLDKVLGMLNWEDLLKSLTYCLNSFLVYFRVITWEVALCRDP